LSKWRVNTEHRFLNLSDITLGTYNLHDSYNTAALVGPLFRELQDRGNLDYVLNIMEPLQRAVINMQARGMLRSREALENYRKEVRDGLNQTDKVILAADPTGELKKPTGKYPNGIGSSQRLGKFLFGTLEFKSTKTTDKGLDSTDQEALGRILKGFRKKDEPHRQVLESIFHRSRLRTIQQRYLNLEAGSDGRVRAQVKMYGTKTMRFAYADPPLQQFPLELRHIFISRPGYLFLQVDYSQLEARILAYLSGDLPSITTFLENKDVHQENACDLFNYSQEDWEQLDSGLPKPTRNFAKSFLYGISYGGEVETMKTKTFCPCPKCAPHMPPTLKLKKTEMKEASDRWHRKHFRVRDWQAEIAEGVRKKHYYQSPMGCRRWIAKPWGPDLDREVKNLPMQFGGALIMNQRQVELDRMEAPIVLQMHDSFLLEVPEDQIDHWASEVKGVMEQPVQGLGDVSLPCDVEVGLNWRDMKPWMG